jgi:carbon monoxide dehydrogenase subunit G
MHFEGKQTLELSQAKAWQFLTDPNQVGQCVPGLQSIAIVDATHFNAEVGFGVGSFTATFTITVEWLELEAPHRARMKMHGSASNSVVDGESEMKLSTVDQNTTNLEWTAEVNIGGTLASVANRLMGGVTQKLTGKFFDCMKEKMEEKERPQKSAAKKKPRRFRLTRKKQSS